MILINQSGCLLPTLIIFNLLIGWIFFKPVVWLSIEAILIILFLINSYIFLKKINSGFKKRDKVIDTQGKVIEDK